MFARFRRKIPAGVSADAWQSALSDKRPLIITIHGTGDTGAADDGPKWWQRGSEFQTKLSASAPADQQPVWLPFRWSGANSDAERFSAAADLAGLCGALSRRGREYSILGHSHAGNVLEYAWSFFALQAGNPSRCLNVVSYGVPFFNYCRSFTNRIAYVANIMVFLLFICAFCWFSIFHLSILYSMFSFFAYHHYDVNLGFEIIDFNALVYFQMWTSILFSVWFSFRDYISYLTYLVIFLVIISSWIFGFRYFLSEIVFQPRWRRATGRNWLAISARRDEVLGLLPKFARKSPDYITSTIVKNSIQSIGISFGAISILLTMIWFFALTTDVSWFINRITLSSEYENYLYGDEGYRDYNFQYLFSPATLGENVITAVQAGFILFFLFRILSYLVSLLPGKRFAARFASERVHQILKASAYGEDFNFNLRTVKPEPQRMRVRLHRLDKDNLGGLSPEVVQDAVTGLYDGVIGFESAEMLVADPEGLWAKLMNALYHNAYFDDDEVIALTANHLWPSTTGNAPGPSTALVSPA